VLVSRPASPPSNAKSLKFFPEQAADFKFDGTYDPLAEFYELAKAEQDNEVGAILLCIFLLAPY